MKILIAEDEQMLKKAVEFKLKKDGHEVFTAADGREALSLIKENAFDMIITDIMMPFASGLEIISHVRAQGFKMPIIVVSSIGLENTVLEAFKLGADDFITKPFSPNELSMRVNRLLSKIL
jgi:DNA-binding response OmpR family regulator